MRGPRIFQKPTYASPMILRQGSLLPPSSELQPGQANDPKRAVSPQEVRADGGSVCLAPWLQDLGH